MFCANEGHYPILQLHAGYDFVHLISQLFLRLFYLLFLQFSYPASTSNLATM